MGLGPIMITKYKTFEEIRWYKDGKLEPNDIDIKVNEFDFSVGDWVSSDKIKYWADIKYQGNRKLTSINNPGKWTISISSRGQIENVDYCDNVDGYTGQIIQLKEPYWPWIQADGFKKTAKNALSENRIFEKSDEMVIDYIGNNVPIEDAVWCKYDKVWCLKKDAIWIDYDGFYTTPEHPNIIKKSKSTSKIRWYNKGKLEFDPESEINIPEYDDFITDDVFRQFLIDNNCYDEFIKYCQYTGDSFGGKYDIHKRVIIDYTVSWSSTDSGSTYWSKIDTKWRNKFDKEKL